jgi:transcriptional regulator with XRE-family HTH domain
MTSGVIARVTRSRHSGRMTVNTEPVGTLVRRWRERRHRSQLDVSLAADVSTRHLSYIETGRATPGRDVIERLCDELDVPLRDRNAFYLGAGYAPVYTERPYVDLGAAWSAVEAVLTALEPNPSLAVNLKWEMLAANSALQMFLAGIPDVFTEPPINVLRATLHPDGLAGRIVNLAQWRRHVLRRVERQSAHSGSAELAELFRELSSYPSASDGGIEIDTAAADDVAVPLRLATDHGELTMLYTTTVFGAPHDITLAEIAIETFFPADARTAEVLRDAASNR